jgi:hypothetical protein
MIVTDIFELEPLQDGARNEADLSGEVDRSPPVLVALQDLEENLALCCSDRKN